MVAATTLGAASVVWGAGPRNGPDDPQVDLTVLSEEADGGCRVAWTDPWGGGRRTADHWCDPTRDHLLIADKWETGIVRASGTARGELYPVREDGRGIDYSPEPEAAVFVGYLALLLGAGAVIGGTVTRLRRGPARR
ncbi:hypothetical protein [Streptomyces sp. NPDC051561]|uniref:hypothetical protein n=1 Tax=Streptomyces sp. NPDC051561 TaxID=3365658 RepID=UPI0037A7FA00